MKRTTKVLALFFVMLFAMEMLAFVAAAEEVSLDEAEEIILNNADSNGKLLGERTGELKEEEKYDLYKINIKESGALSIKLKSDFKIYLSLSPIFYEIFDEEGNQLNGSEWLTHSGAHQIEYNYDCLAGIYYIKLDQGWWMNEGKYTFTIAFEPCKESFSESLLQSFNSRDTAPEIIIGGNYDGQIAVNDTIDLYCLQLYKQQAFNIGDFDRDSNNKYSIFNYANEEVWSMAGNENTSCSLDSGVYYLEVTKQYNQTGNYSFMLFTRGDLDNDGSISSADARTTLRMSVGLENVKQNSAAFAAADFNNNGLIQPDDARSILRVSVGLEP